MLAPLIETQERAEYCVLRATLSLKGKAHITSIPIY